MKMLRWMSAATLALSLFGCGGGGGDAGSSPFGGGNNPTNTDSTASIAVVLSNSVVTSGQSVTATATVRSTTTNAVLSGKTVNFSVANGRAQLSQASATTDAQGIATTTLTVQPGQSFGADVLTASLTQTTGTTSATANFTSNSATAVDVLANANSVPSASSVNNNQVQITAIVKGSGNVGLANTPVTFTADSGLLVSASTTTDATGVASAKFAAGPDKTNRLARITVTSGSAVGSLTVPIEGTALAVSGPTTVAFASTSTLSVKATDSSGAPISNAVLNVSSQLGATLSAAAVTTNPQGQATVNYTANRAGTDTVTFSGLGISSSSSIVVSAEDFSFLSPAAATTVTVGVSQALQVRYQQAGVPVAGRIVTFAATGGTLSASSATTNAAGIASVNISALVASPVTVQAQLVGGTAQATLPLSFVAVTPSRLVLQVTPTAIGPNPLGAATNQAQVVAKVVDANANPIAGVTVNFSRDTDPSGGNYLQPSAATDLNGVATVQYASGPQATANDGVVLRATVAAPFATVTGTTSLTVSQSALFIALGTGNTISNVDPQTYKKDWTVYVTDANGVAVQGVSVTAKVLPMFYRKGRLAFNGTNWSAVVAATPPVTVADGAGGQVLVAGTYISCPNEDTFFGDASPLSYNGVLDAGEDVNNSRKLEPGNVISLSSGQVTTDGSGRATLSLVYAESYVPWVDVKLQVQARVSGTASLTEASFVVEGLSDDFTDQAVPPAGVVSPFGRRSVCTDQL